MKYNKSIIRVSVIASVFSLASQCASAKCYYNDDKTAAGCSFDISHIFIDAKENNSINVACEPACEAEGLNFVRAEWIRDADPPAFPEAGKMWCICQQPTK